MVKQNKKIIIKTGRNLAKIRLIVTIILMDPIKIKPRHEDEHNNDRRTNRNEQKQFCGIRKNK